MRPYILSYFPVSNAFLERVFSHDSDQREKRPYRKDSHVHLTSECKLRQELILFPGCPYF